MITCFPNGDRDMNYYTIITKPYTTVKPQHCKYHYYTTIEYINITTLLSLSLYLYIYPYIYIYRPLV